MVMAVKLKSGRRCGWRPQPRIARRRISGTPALTGETPLGTIRVVQMIDEMATPLPSTFRISTRRPTLVALGITMAAYLIGDVRATTKTSALLQPEVEFRARYSTLWLTGGWSALRVSLDVLRYVKSLGLRSVRWCWECDLHTCWPYSPGLAATNLKTG